MFNELSDCRGWARTFWYFLQEPDKNTASPVPGMHWPARGPKSELTPQKIVELFNKHNQAIHDDEGLALLRLGIRGQARPYKYSLYNVYLEGVWLTNSLSHRSGIPPSEWSTQEVIDSNRKEQTLSLVEAAMNLAGHRPKNEADIPKLWHDQRDDENRPEWRSLSVKRTREWAAGSMDLFLTARLNYQKKTLETENYSLWDNPEQALFDLLLTVRGEEGLAWTEEERRKTNKITAGLISVCQRELAGDPKFNRPSEFLQDITDGLFNDMPSVELDDNELLALNEILKRAGRKIDTKQNHFPKPNFFPGS